MAKTNQRKSGATALEQASRATRKLNPVWTPQPGPQVDAILADWCPILLFGGAKFGGKSDFLLGDYLKDVPKYKEHWQGILFRRSYKQFTELITRSKQLYPKAGAEWKKGDSEWHFKEGSILRFRYLESLDDIENYWGHSYPWIGVDEVGEWEEEKAFFRLFTLLRYGQAPIPTKRLRASANPGGAGHQFVKKYFIDPAPRGYEPIWDDQLKMHRLFIPSSLDDNVIGLENDPGYEARMSRAGSEALVKAWRYGLWDIVAGAFFSMNRNVHMCEPFVIPTHWPRQMVMDFGGCGDGDPFAIGWWAISDGSIPNVPRGCGILYRLWYGADLPQQTVASIAEGIQYRESKDPPIQMRLAGRDVFKKFGGPSLNDQFARYDIRFRMADDTREAGWQETRNRLDYKNKPPLIKCFYPYDEWFDNMAALQHDKRDANDAAQANDHIAEMTRYFVMGPLDAKDPDPAPQNMLLPPKLTLDSLWDQKEMR